MDKIQAEAICELIVSDINGGKISPRDAWIKHLLPLQSQPPAKPDPKGDALEADLLASHIMDTAKIANGEWTVEGQAEARRLILARDAALLASKQGQGDADRATYLLGELMSYDNFEAYPPNVKDRVCAFIEHAELEASKAHPQPSGLRAAGARLDRALSSVFWTSDDGWTRQPGCPDDDDLDQDLAEAWRDLRAALAQADREAQG